MGQLLFQLDKDENSWFIKMNDDGIFFNREKYPNATHNDFAIAFMQFLEIHYDVKFIEKKKE